MGTFLEQPAHRLAFSAPRCPPEGPKDCPEFSHMTFGFGKLIGEGFTQVTVGCAFGQSWQRLSDSDFGIIHVRQLIEKEGFKRFLAAE
jgi:hypothetical protein